MSNVLITGVLGQDGSYLAELMLEKGHQVYGILRRVSTGTNYSNISSIVNNENFHLIEGDILDIPFMSGVLQDLKPEMMFNLAAQSHVGYSFKAPVETFRVDAEAVISQLDLIRKVSPETRFYQASTSEMFGGVKVPDNGYDENSLLLPRSPYAIAKVAAHHAVINYRESYGLYACSGILFNHSCLDKESPLIVRINNNIDIIQVKDLLKFNGNEETLDLNNKNIEIWDGFKWVDLKTVTVRPVEKHNLDFFGKITNTRSGIVSTTRHHNLLNSAGNKIKARDATEGVELLHGNYPVFEKDMKSLTMEEAWLIGMIVGDGWVSSKTYCCHIANNSDDISEKIVKIWKIISNNDAVIGKFYVKKGFNGKSRIIKLTGFSDWHLSSFLRDMIYNSEGKKKIPLEILNSSKSIQQSFLNGYNCADGLKKSPCTYKYKNFKTNSMTLGQGLLFLIKNVTNQNYNLNAEEDKYGRVYYSINLLSDRQSSEDKKDIVKEMLNSGLSQRETNRRTGISRNFIRKIYKNEKIMSKHYRFKNRIEVKKNITKELDYVYDIETSSGQFMCGVGTLVIANSPRRGLDFATRKITKGVAEISLGMRSTIQMGNMESYRDEGHAKDYVKAMYMMLNNDLGPIDYVVSTNQTASIREMLEYVSSLANLSYDDVYEMNPEFMRPSDVPFLLGNSDKIRRELGWEPEYDWKKLLKEMYEYDRVLLQK